MVILLVSVCVVEAALLVGCGLYAEFLELRKREERHRVAGHPPMSSIRH